MEYSSEQLRALAREFCPDGITKDPVPLGNGHINDTFLFEAQGRSHVLQRINRNVFREPEKQSWYLPQQMEPRFGKLFMILPVPVLFRESITQISRLKALQDAVLIMH